MQPAKPHGTCDIHSIVEVYDSGTTHHLSPYRHLFTTFHPIPAKQLHAANQMTFQAIGVGDMLVDMPNRSEIMQVKLKDVLYAPEVGYTLISMGKIDAVGCYIKLGQQ